MGISDCLDKYDLMSFYMYHLLLWLKLLDKSVNAFVHFEFQC